MPSSSIALARTRTPVPLAFSERKSSSTMTTGKRKRMGVPPSGAVRAKRASIGPSGRGWVKVASRVGRRPGRTSGGPPRAPIARRGGQGIAACPYHRGHFQRPGSSPMAGTSLIALIDDIATVLDDISDPDQGRRAQDRRRPGRRPGPQRPAGHGGARRARAAGGLGGGQGVPGQQGDPGSGGAGDQRGRALGHPAAADGGRRLSVLTRVSRSSPTSCCTPSRRTTTHHAELTAGASGSRGRPGGPGEGQDQGRRSARTSSSPPRSSSSPWASSRARRSAPRLPCWRGSASS